MSKLSDADFYDIVEYVCLNMDSFIENYNRFGSTLNLDDYILTRTATQLNHKYSRYSVQECFEHPKMQAIISFYSNNDTRSAKIH